MLKSADHSVELSNMVGGGGELYIIATHCKNIESPQTVQPFSCRDFPDENGLIHPLHSSSTQLL